MLSISCSLIAVFIPLLLMGGIIGRLFREFALTVTASIVVSAVVSLTLAPMLCARFMHRAPDSHGPIYRFIERGFDAISVVTDTDTLTPPCGACRQLIWEFCGDVPVILANLKGKTEVIPMRDLFPKPFDSSNL